MKKNFRALIILAGILIVLSGFRAKNYQSDYAIDRFAQLPVLEGGRLKPIDSLARNSLLLIHGKQTIRKENKKQAIEWFMDLVFYPEKAAAYPSFRIDNDQVLGLIGKKQDKQKYFSFNTLEPYINQIQRQYRSVPEEPLLRNSYQQAIVKLHNSLMLYMRLQHTFRPFPQLFKTVEAEYNYYILSINEMWEKVQKQGFNISTEDYAWNAFNEFLDYYEASEDWAIVYPVPLASQTRKDNLWFKIATLLAGDSHAIEKIKTEQMDPIVLAYAQLVDSYRAQEPAIFNQKVNLIEQKIKERQPIHFEKIRLEYHFNIFQPFYRALILFFLAFLLIFIGWLFSNNNTCLQAAFWLSLIAFALHTIGLIIRIYIQERPPVTNLYSSAVFVGWVAVLMGILIERIYKNGMGNAVGAAVGFVSLIIAHHLSLGGDTMEMLVAVLDTNFWLATHVPTITIGYAATFLSGFLGMLFVIRGFFTKSLNLQTAKTISGMVYGIVCFALFFSFTGTVLGGIWADQSWGRFWGWDPKENGALLIVLWNAIILHSRWGRLVGIREIMNMAIFGNIVTAWSWFGTNMLGEGLHSYGFTDQGFIALLLFCLSQLLFILFGSLPERYWRSKLTL